MQKFLADITREEWVTFIWIDVTEIGEERTMARCGLRTPEEAAIAMEQWDTTAEVRQTAINEAIGATDTQEKGDG